MAEEFMFTYNTKYRSYSKEKWRVFNDRLYMSFAAWNELAKLSTLWLVDIAGVPSIGDTRFIRSNEVSYF